MCKSENMLMRWIEGRKRELPSYLFWFNQNISAQQESCEVKVGDTAGDNYIRWDICKLRDKSMLCNAL